MELTKKEETRMNKFEIVKSRNQKYPYNARILTSVDGGDSYYYCGNGRYCKTLQEAFEFIKGKAAEELKEEINNEIDTEEIIEKSFDIVEKFYQHMTEANRPVSEKDISDMQWVLDNIIPAIKKGNRSKIQGGEFSSCSGWNYGYSSLMIIGATPEQVISKAKTREDWENVFLNYCQNDNRSISLDAYRVDPKEAADFFCEIDKSIRVYASWHWDEDSFVARCDGNDYHGYTAKFENGTPRKSDDDDYFDVDVEIVDTETGCKFLAGGGMCTAEETDWYRKLVAEHTTKKEN